MAIKRNTRTYFDKDSSYLVGEYRDKLISINLENVKYVIEK